MSGALANKNPSVKAETAGFLARALCYCTPTILTKKLLKVIVTDLLKGVSEPGKEIQSVNDLESLQYQDIFFILGFGV